MFTSERGAPFSTAGFARMVERVGREAKLAFKAHPHMLRHACGYALANKGHDLAPCKPTSAQEHSAYGALHRTIADAVQGFLAGLGRGLINGQQNAQVVRLRMPVIGSKANVTRTCRHFHL